MPAVRRGRARGKTEPRQVEDSGRDCGWLALAFLAQRRGRHSGRPGGEIEVPTLQGKAQLKVPAGTQSGQLFKLRGKGIMNVNGRERGDLLARLLVEVPTRLNSEQRHKIEEFAALCGEENTPLRKSFFERAREFFRDV